MPRYRRRPVSISPPSGSSLDSTNDDTYRSSVVDSLTSDPVTNKRPAHNSKSTVGTKRRKKEKRPTSETKDQSDPWLVKWMSSEVFKVANSFLECGKKYIRYISNSDISTNKSNPSRSSSDQSPHVIEISGRGRNKKIRKYTVDSSTFRKLKKKEKLEKFVPLPKKRLTYKRGPLPDSIASKGLKTLGYDKDCIEDILRILKTAYGGSKKVNLYKVTVAGTNSDNSKLEDTTDYHDATSLVLSEDNEDDTIKLLYKSTYPSFESQRIESIDELDGKRLFATKPSDGPGLQSLPPRRDHEQHNPLYQVSDKRSNKVDTANPLNREFPTSHKKKKKKKIPPKANEESKFIHIEETNRSKIRPLHEVKTPDNSKTECIGTSKPVIPFISLETLCENLVSNGNQINALPIVKKLTEDLSNMRLDLEVSNFVQKSKDRSDHSNSIDGQNVEDFYGGKGVKISKTNKKVPRLSKAVIVSSQHIERTRSNESYDGQEGSCNSDGATRDSEIVEETKQLLRENVYKNWVGSGSAPVGNSKQSRARAGSVELDKDDCTQQKFDGKGGRRGFVAARNVGQTKKRSRSRNTEGNEQSGGAYHSNPNGRQSEDASPGGTSQRNRNLSEEATFIRKDFYDGRRTNTSKTKEKVPRLSRTEDISSHIQRTDSSESSNEQNVNIHGGVGKTKNSEIVGTKKLRDPNRISKNTREEFRTARDGSVEFDKENVCIQQKLDGKGGRREILSAGNVGLVKKRSRTRQAKISTANEKAPRSSRTEDISRQRVDSDESFDELGEIINGSVEKIQDAAFVTENKLRDPDKTSKNWVGESTPVGNDNQRNKRIEKYGRVQQKSVDGEVGTGRISTAGSVEQSKKRSSKQTKYSGQSFGGANRSNLDAELFESSSLGVASQQNRYSSELATDTVEDFYYGTGTKISNTDETVPGLSREVVGSSNHEVQRTSSTESSSDGQNGSINDSDDAIRDSEMGGKTKKQESVNISKNQVEEGRTLVENDRQNRTRARSAVFAHEGGIIERKVLDIGPPREIVTERYVGQSRRCSCSDHTEDRKQSIDGSRGTKHSANDQKRSSSSIHCHQQCIGRNADDNISSNKEFPIRKTEQIVSDSANIESASSGDKSHRSEETMSGSSSASSRKVGPIADIDVDAQSEIQQMGGEQVAEITGGTSRAVSSVDEKSTRGSTVGLTENNEMSNTVEDSKQVDVESVTNAFKRISRDSAGSGSTNKAPMVEDLNYTDHVASNPMETKRFSTESVNPFHGNSISRSIDVQDPSNIKKQIESNESSSTEKKPSHESSNKTLIKSEKSCLSLIKREKSCLSVVGVESGSRGNSEEKTDELIALVESQKYNSEGSHFVEKIAYDIPDEAIVASSATNEQPVASSTSSHGLGSQEQSPQEAQNAATIIASTVDPSKANDGVNDSLALLESPKASLLEEGIVNQPQERGEDSLSANKAAVSDPTGEPLSNERKLGTQDDESSLGTKTSLSVPNENLEENQYLDQMKRASEVPLKCVQETLNMPTNNETDESKNNEFPSKDVVSSSSSVGKLPDVGLTMLNTAISPITSGTNIPLFGKSTSNSKVVPTEGAIHAIFHPPKSEKSSPVPERSGTPSRKNSGNRTSDLNLSISERAAAARDRLSASRALNASSQSIKKKIDNRSHSPSFSHQRVSFSKVQESFSYATVTSSGVNDPSNPIIAIAEDGSRTKLIFKDELKPPSSEDAPQITGRRETMKVLPPIREQSDEDPVYRPRESPADIKMYSNKLFKNPSLTVVNLESVSEEDNSENFRQSDQSSDVITAVRKHSSLEESCNCRSMCNCCKCGQKKDSLPDSHTKVEKNEHDHGKDGPFDYSTPPYPKDSLKVLNSPFFAHWDVYDIDQDHPVSKYVKRAEQTAADTECIIVKNYKLGDLSIPYLNITSRKKMSTKLVCNYYKNRSLISKPRDAQTHRETKEGSDAALAPHCSAHSAPEGIGRSEMKSCTCSKKKNSAKEDSDLWENYSKSQEFVIPVEMSKTFSKEAEPNEAEAGCQAKTQFCCDLGKECSCIELPEFVRNKSPLLLPTTPCQSCDCFIDGVASDSTGHTVTTVHSGHQSSVTEVSYEESDSTPEVTDYIEGLQNLVIQLYGMLGKMKNTANDPDEKKKPKEGRKSSVHSPP